MEYIKITNDPILNLVRKAEIVQFTWNMESKNFTLHVRIRFYEADEISEIQNQRIQPYNVILSAYNEIATAEVSPEVGDYDNFINLYFNNSIVLYDIFVGIILQRDAEGRFDS